MKYSLRLACQMIAVLTGNKRPEDILDRSQDRFVVLTCRHIALTAIRSQDGPVNLGDVLYLTNLQNVLRVTAPELLVSSAYIGDNSTITELYCFATDEDVKDYSGLFVRVEGRQYITCDWGEGGYSEPCHFCGQPGKTMLVPAELHANAPYRKGESGFQRWVFQHFDGETIIAACSEHDGSKVAV